MNSSDFGLFGFFTCSSFLGFFVIVFGFFALLRYMQYRETIALADKGLLRPVKQSGNGTGMLRWGIVIAALGLALSIGFYPLGFALDRGASLFPLHFGPWMLIGLVPLFFGLALILIHVVTREPQAAESQAAPSLDQGRETTAPGNLDTAKDG